MSVSKKTEFYPLGRFIEQVSYKLGSSEKCQISGVNINHEFIPTVANMVGIDTSKYKIVPQYCFACNLMHIGRDVALPLAYNHLDKVIAVSPAYYVFRIKEEFKEKLSNEYLEMILTRNEFERLAWFYTDGSIRGNLPEQSLFQIHIPLPSIEDQNELVATYNGLRTLAEQNEALIGPLSLACEACIADCKKKYPEIELCNGLDNYIEMCDQRNKEGLYSLDDVRGISIQKKLIPTKADMKGVALTPYKILKPQEFCYVTVTSRNGDKISLAINDNPKKCIVSSSYIVFKCIDTKKLLPQYLFLILKRNEFDRYTRFNSWGSARETFDWNELCRVRIPLPSIKVQKSIVDIYNCLEKAKNIASEARENLKKICPALIQRAINS